MTTNNANSTVPFWRRIPLNEMSDDQWESLCDGCGRCCLNKLEDAETGEIFFTDVACGLLDRQTCRCTNYPKRSILMPDCVNLTPDKTRELRWLPSTCAYRLVAEGRDLFDWHPLVSGDAATVHRAGISVRGRTVSESDVVDFEDHVVTWPK